jgi:pyruvate-formate lyase-activating enzyme
MDNLADFLNKLNNPDKEIHFLPFHPLARTKLKRLGLEDKLSGFHAVDEGELYNFAEAFRRQGFRVKIGG